MNCTKYYYRYIKPKLLSFFVSHKIWELENVREYVFGSILAGIELYKLYSNSNYRCYSSIENVNSLNDWFCRVSICYKFNLSFQFTFIVKDGEIIEKNNMSIVIRNNEDVINFFVKNYVTIVKSNNAMKMNILRNLYEKEFYR